MQLAELIADPDTDLAPIADLLDGLSGPQRWAQLQPLDRALQRALFQKAAPDPIALDHFVPDATARVEIIHDGLNTLPTARWMRRFQKRFCRPEGDPLRLFGYNEGPLRRVIGPGYFVASATQDQPEWRRLGGVVVDYFKTPQAPVVDGWPRVVPNGRGLQRYVYHETRDFMRRVSAHVSIGAAYKRDQPLDHYFVLCRRV